MDGHQAAQDAPTDPTSRGPLAETIQGDFMRKKGARITHRAKTAPTMIAQAINPNYEIRLRTAVDAFRGGWAQVTHFNDLAETFDMLRIGMAVYTGQKHDESATAVAELAGVAIHNILYRHQETGELSATEEEQDALQLLADTSIDYWSRRSGALYVESVRQLELARKKMKEAV